MHTSEHTYRKHAYANFLSSQIKENRKRAALTQEQVANYLGVSAPAVNKWERGISFPDISLLPPLARLLKIDLNTLFSFHEKLTDQEVKLFAKELIEAAQGGDHFASSFKMASDKIREYPHCANLIYSAANALDACLILTQMSLSDKEAYEQQIMNWYERAADSSEETVKYSACCMLVGKYMKNSEYDKAKTLIEKLPDRNLDKAFFQADLLSHQNKAEEAAVLLEGKLLQDLGNVQTCLYKLIEMEVKAKQTEKARQTAEITQNMVSLFGMWPYGAAVPFLQIAVYQKDAEQSIKLIKKLLEAAKTGWDLSASPLFYRIAQASTIEKTTSPIGNYFIPALITEFENDSAYDFLRGNRKFEDLLEEIRRDFDER